MSAPITNQQTREFKLHGERTMETLGQCVAGETVVGTGAAGHTGCKGEGGL